jgi:hypothetical protein
VVWGGSSLELSRVSSMRPIDFGPEETGKTLAGDIRRGAMSGLRHGLIGPCVQRGASPTRMPGSATTRERDRKFADSPLEGAGFELSVPRSR